MTQVTFKHSRGINLTVDLGDGSPILSGGNISWDTVARPKRKSMTRFSGQAPFTQDLPLMFDGFLDREGQEKKIDKLVRMSTEVGTVQLSGHALRLGLKWVITGIDWDDANTIWEQIGNARVRTRQSCTIHLLEYVPDSIIDTPAHPKVNKNKPAKKVPVAKGWTLRKIAQVEYGQANYWPLIRNANLGICIGMGPRSVVMAGITLAIPEPDGSTQYFTVP